MLVSGVGATRRAEFGDETDNSAFRVSADSRLGRKGISNGCIEIDFESTFWKGEPIFIHS